MSVKSNLELLGRTRRSDRFGKVRAHSTQLCPCRGAVWCPHCQVGRCSGGTSAWLLKTGVGSRMWPRSAEHGCGISSPSRQRSEQGVSVQETVGSSGRELITRRPAWELCPSCRQGLGSCSGPGCPSPRREISGRALRGAVRCEEWSAPHSQLWRTVWRLGPGRHMPIPRTT